MIVCVNRSSERPVSPKKTFLFSDKYFSNKKKKTSRIFAEFKKKKKSQYRSDESQKARSGALNLYIYM